MDDHFVIAVEEDGSLLVAKGGVATGADAGGAAHGESFTLLLTGYVAFDGEQDV